MQVVGGLNNPPVYFDDQVARQQACFVRRATATYLGKVLSVTFDSAIEPEDRIAIDLRKTGADIQPLAPHAVDRRTLWRKALDGDLNEEISCGLGLLFLIAAKIVESATTLPPLAHHALYFGAYVFTGQQGVRSAIASLRARSTFMIKPIR